MLRFRRRGGRPAMTMSTENPSARAINRTRGRVSAWLRAQYQGYLGILLVGSSARMFGLASQFVVLIILGRMLGKADFGDLMAAFGFYRLVAIAIGTEASLGFFFFSFVGAPPP